MLTPTAQCPRKSAAKAGLASEQWTLVKELTIAAPACLGLNLNGPGDKAGLVRLREHSLERSAIATWSPISLHELHVLIRQSVAEMSVEQQRLWELIGIQPEKWDLPPWGDVGGGFWVVGLFGKYVIWYNDIEDGFNIGRYDERGRINDYLCNQSDLKPVLWDLMYQIKTGEPPGACGPPQPLPPFN